MDLPPRRTYHAYDPAQGYPRSTALYWECTVCKDVIPSASTESTHCKCDNIRLDVDAGRLAIKDHARVKLFSVDER